MEVLMEIIVDLLTDKLGDKVLFPNKPQWPRILLTVMIGLFVTGLFALGASYSEWSVMRFICWICTRISVIVTVFVAFHMAIND